VSKICRFDRVRSQKKLTEDMLLAPVVQNEAATPAETVDALSNKLITLTRRFYPSEVALPLRELCFVTRAGQAFTKAFVSAAIVISQLEEFALVDLEPEAQSSTLNDDNMWIVNSLHEGGVPWQVLYEHYDLLFKARVRPKKDAPCGAK